MDPQIHQLLTLQAKILRLKTKGREMQEELLRIFNLPDFTAIISKVSFDQGKLSFVLLGQEYYTYVVVSADDNGVYSFGQLNTYFQFKPIGKKELDEPIQIYSEKFDGMGNINQKFTIDDFGFNYIKGLVGEINKNPKLIIFRD